MAGALGLKLAGPRSYGGVVVPDAYMGDGRADASAAISGARSRLPKAAWLIMFAAIAVCASSPRELEQRFHVDVLREVGGEFVQRLLDQAFVGKRIRGARAKRAASQAARKASEANSPCT